MSYITLKCKNCGANMALNTESHSATCNHCGSTFLISDILDEKDSSFVSKFSSKELEQKMYATDSIKQGETFIAKCEYEKAEACFKKAIEYDDSNYRSYLGVVKAKTENFNKLPENDDYLQYAHYALNLATGDDLTLVRSELSKIDLLATEQRRQKKIFSSNEKKEEKYRKHKKDVKKVFGIITVFILLMLGGTIFVSSMFTDLIFEPTGIRLTVEIDSYEDFSRVFSNNKYLDYTINLTADIDCQGNTITPLGSQTNAFTGSFNGNKHTISNAVIDGTDKNYVGLFGCTVLASINNLVLDNIKLDVHSTPTTGSISYYGLLAGKTESTNITNVEIKNTCEVSIKRDIDYPTSIGGLVGSANNASFISGISSHANISVMLTQIIKPADSYVGGIAGTCQNSVIQKTCSNSDIFSTISNTCYRESSTYLGGIIGSIISPTTKDILNIDYNHFSGIACLSASNIIKTNLSAIAHSDLKINRLLNNACLYTSTNFVLNSSYLSHTKLNDYSIGEYFVDFCTANDTYLSKLDLAFSEWNNSDTLEPNLA